MLEFAKNQEFWETVIVKSGFVMSKEGHEMRDMIGYAAGSKKAIRINELALGLVDVAAHGSAEETLQNEAMVMRGQRVLKATIGTK